MSSKNWIYLLLVLVAFCSELSSALRCYTCEDCDEQSQVKELVVCAAPVTQQNPVAAEVPSSIPSTNPSTSPSTSPAATPAASPAGTALNTPAAAPAAAGTPSGVSRPPAAAPAAAPAVNSEDEEDYESDEEESVGTGAAAPGAAAAGTATGAGAPAAAAAGGVAAPASASAIDSDAEEDEDEDYDDRRRRRASRQVMTNTRAVCYIASLRLNDTEITNRGCTIVPFNGDQSNACNSLYNGWEVAGCTVCDENGCNAPIHATSTGQYSSSSSRMNALTELTLGVALLAIAMA